MQPGVCFEAETNVLAGERFVFLVETNVSRRQKRFVFQAGTNVLVLSKLGTGSSGKRKHMFSSKNQRFSCENVSFRARNKPFLETLVWNWKLKTNSVGTSLKSSKTNLFSTSLFVCFCENVCFRNVCFRYGNKLFYRTFVLGWNNKLPDCQAETFVFHGHGKFLFRTNLFVWKNLRFETLVWKQWN